MTFSEYVEDVLDLQMGLLRSEEIEECRLSFKNFTSKTKVVAEKHVDSGLKLTELRSKVKRLTEDQVYTSNKNKNNFDVTFINNHIEKGEALLSGKNTKSMLLDFITANSDISRQVNSIINK